VGFRDAKAQVLACLDDENILHDLQRSEIDTKNLLVTGVVSAEEVAAAIGRSNGREYECSAHHFDATIDVHIIKTMCLGRSWYIKWYYLEPDVVFISVHE
jgi:hypothetical protein